MTRWIICAIVLAWAVSGCSGVGADGGSAESLASVQQAAVAPARTCKNYDGFTAALAEATVACLGAIGPFDYTTDQLGLLAPAFDSCPAEAKAPPADTNPNKTAPALLRIKRLLSLQRPGNKRDDFAPNAVPCIRDAYIVAARTLAANGVTVCPNWHKVFVGGVPSAKNAQALRRRMPFPHPVADPTTGAQVLVVDPPKPGSGFRFPKEYFFYTVSFDGQKVAPEQSCGSAVACAKACSSLFEGFFVGRFGRYIVGDPYWWLDPTDYGGFDELNDPYNRVNGYYHPMSLAGDDVPGQIYGDFGRAAFKDPNDQDPSQQAELCTRWDGSMHRMARLVQDMLFDDEPETWLSRCEFYPPSAAPDIPPL